jgi:hypothetical protein
LERFADNILGNGSLVLKNTYGITLQKQNYKTWNPPNSALYDKQLYPAMIDHAKENYSGWDIVVFLTSYPDANNNGIGYGSAGGLIMNVPASMTNNKTYNLFQHEISHVFGCSDAAAYHSKPHSLPNNHCIMCGGCDLIPTNYCSECNGILLQNRDRFDSIGYGYIVLEARFFGGSYSDPRNMLGPSDDGKFAYIYSGPNAGDKAYIMVGLSRAPAHEASGHLWVYCKTPSASGAHIVVSVAGYDDVWRQVKQTNLYPPNTVIALYCGHVENVDKVTVTAFNQAFTGYPSNPSYLYVDAVVLS